MDRKRGNRGRGPRRPQGNNPRGNQPLVGARPEGPRRVERTRGPCERGRGGPPWVLSGAGRDEPPGAFNGRDQLRETPTGSRGGLVRGSRGSNRGGFPGAPSDRGRDHLARTLSGRTREGFQVVSDRRGGSNRSEGGLPKQRQPREMTYEKLVELSTKDPGEVLITLRNGNSGFMEVLNAVRLGNDVLLVIVTVIATACKSTLHRHNLMALITDVLDSNLVSVHLPNYLNRVPYMADYNIKVDFMKKVALPLKTFLNTAIHTVPTLANEKLQLCVTTFQTSFGAILPRVPAESVAMYREMLTELEDMRKVMMRPLEEVNKKMSQLVLESANDAPENFRQIQIEPTTEELRREMSPFLRENIVVGRYRDGAHYLDVQFRLLREDFVGPLRDGIIKYRELLGAASAGGAAAKALAKMKELSVYRKVKLVEIVNTESGVVYILRLDPVALRNVDWAHSKKLRTGSLLCVSPDDFTTMALAVVFSRDLHKLRKGYLEVQIIQGIEVVVVPNAPAIEFVVAESPAYFESYGPILKGLQALDDDKLPFSKYIIEVNTDVVPPKYLTNGMRRDLATSRNRSRGNRSLQRAFEEACVASLIDLGIRSDEDGFGKDIVEVNTNINIAAEPKDTTDNVCYDLSPLLKTNEDPPIWRKGMAEPRLIAIQHLDSWPDKDELGLDASQYRALQWALTRELAIIQGPPGTGKTFLGLKVMEVLLRNKAVWMQRDAPILVICFTNHALDQFLEGILERVGRNGIVRIGGGSKSEKLSSINLKVLRRDKMILRSMSRNGQNTSKDIRCRKSDISRSMDTIEDQLAGLTQKLIPEMYLEKFMTINHAEHFLQLREYFEVEFGMQLWLNVEVPEEYRYTVGREEPEALGAEAAGNVNLAEEQLEDDVAEDRKMMLEDNYDVDTLGNFYHNQYLYEEERSSRSGYVRNLDVQGGPKNFNEILRREMEMTDVMTDTEVELAYNLDMLFPRDRWRLYRYWVSKMTDECLTKLEALQRDYERITLQLKEVEMEEEVQFIKTATVVGMTTTGAAKHQSALQQVKPQIVIVEEAAEVLEAHILTALTEECQHLILIGDHQQLRPNTAVYKLAKRYNLDVSLFERMIKNDIPYRSLNLQHRMRPQIARLLVPNIYKELLNDPSVEDRPQIKGVAHSVFFVNHNALERNVADSTSKENLFEADYATALCRHLLLQGYEGEQITVLTTYIGQLYQLKNRMRNESFAGVRTTVVDNYQGEENDIIILSLVRSNEESKIGFLKVENRVCVALSRARNGLFAIGNFDFLVENGGAVWNPIVNRMTRAELIGPALKLMCHNHSDMVIEAKCAQDFKKSPEGGCNRPCEYRLPCGHQCALQCHTYDSKHTTKKTACHKPCVKTCVRSHKCPKKCYTDCGSCLVEVHVVLPVCGHYAIISCHMDISKVKCIEKCPLYLNCGHICKGYCSSPCTYCTEECPLDLSCGHGKCKGFCSAPCTKCTEKCPLDLKCGHKCKGYCSYPCTKCTEKCPLDLKCGHKCKGYCSAPCTKCTEECPLYFTCGHKCSRKCGDRCNVTCHEMCPLELSCGHKCKGGCSAPCPKCSEKCPRDLSCGHKCTGYCGDPCTNNCSVLVEVQSECGHTVKMPCSKKDDQSLAKQMCRAHCNRVLDCEHRCCGSCGGCYQGRFHASCGEKCGKVLVCGHLCKAQCSVACPPCTGPCDNRCVHFKCPCQCGVPCKQCTEPCAWRCDHFQCTKLCWEQCDRPPCNRPCLKTLPCGHQCIGMCGEPCPKKCRVCNRAEVCEILFGEEDASFVELQNCGHVIEVVVMDHWMKEENKGSNEILVKNCPKCQTAIRATLRYGNQVKKMLSDVVDINRKIFGQVYRKDLLTTGILNKRATLYTAHYWEIYDRIEGSLKRPMIPRSEFTFLENLANISNEIVQIHCSASKLKGPQVIPDQLTEINGWILGTVPMRHTTRGNEQQLKQVVLQLNRTNLHCKLLEILAKGHLNERAKTVHGEAMSLVTSRQPFTDASVTTLMDLLKEIQKHQPGLRISSEGRIQILKAVGASAGHWFKCPNGHIYASADFGGATEEGKCLACKSTIRGHGSQPKLPRRGQFHRAPFPHRGTGARGTWKRRGY